MLISFIFLNENICCGYSLEAPRRGASNEHTQNMFSSRNKTNIMWIPPLICSYATVSNDSAVYGQRNLWSDCVDAKANRPIRICPDYIQFRMTRLLCRKRHARHGELWQSWSEYMVWELYRCIEWPRSSVFHGGPDTSISLPFNGV